MQGGAVFVAQRQQEQEIFDALQIEPLELFGQYRADAAKAGVFGVPTFVVDGQLIWGRQTMDEVEEAIRQAGVPRKGRRG